MASRRQRGSVILWKGKRGNVWRIKYADAKGKAVMETIGPEAQFTRRQVELELAKRLIAVDEKGKEKTKPVTFRDYQTRWFVEQERMRQWKPATVVIYANVLKRLTTHFGPMRLGEIRPRDVAAYVVEQSKVLGAATVGRDAGLLYDVLSTAKKEELIDSNPAEDADRPRIEETEWRILKPDEVRRVAQAFTDPQARTMFLTLAQLGLRKSELQALRWRDVSLVEKSLRVVASKSKAGRRTLAIPPLLLDDLERHYQRTAYKGDDDRVFCHPLRGTVYSKEIWTPLFAAALKAAGIKDRVRPFHDLRHSAITNRAAAGLTPIVLMYEAGHSSMAITQRYINLAGVVFAEDAARAEARMRGAVSTEPSTELSETQSTEQDAAGLTARE